MSLAEAEGAARSAGLRSVTARDLLQSRSQVVAATWQVCTQEPAPGPADQDAAVVVGVVRTDEVCPGVDAGLPDLVGKPLPDAQTAATTAGFSRFTSHDATGDRAQIEDRNWRVCSQVPAAGATDRGLAVAVAVVKTAEACPGGAPPPTTTTSAPTGSPRPAPRPAPKPNPQVGADERSDDPPRRTSEPERQPEPEPERDVPSQPRSGHSGHPCLPGERDGDGDGFCGEGR